MADKRSDLEHFSGEPLTEIENKKLRKIIRDEERMTWLWGTLRVWAGWGAATAGFFYMLWEPLSRAVKAMIR